MAEPKQDEFLDDIEQAAEEEGAFADEMIDIDAEASAYDELDAVKAERDEFKDRFRRRPRRA